MLGSPSSEISYTEGMSWWCLCVLRPCSPCFFTACSESCLPTLVEWRTGWWLSPCMLNNHSDQQGPGVHRLSFPSIPSLETLVTECLPLGFLGLHDCLYPGEEAPHRRSWTFYTVFVLFRGLKYECRRTNVYKWKKKIWKADFISKHHSAFCVLSFKWQQLLLSYSNKMVFPHKQTGDSKSQRPGGKDTSCMYKKDFLWFLTYILSVSFTNCELLGQNYEFYMCKLTTKCFTTCHFISSFATAPWCFFSDWEKPASQYLLFQVSSLCWA